jgi:hypothetical protein
MFRNALFASAIALAAATTGAAHAQAPDVGGYAPSIAGNVVGGGVASIAGGGDNQAITYALGGAGAGQAVLAQPPRLARARNSIGGGSLSVEYLEPETARPGREAWLLGGGDNAEVVYRNPR